MEVRLLYSVLAFIISGISISHAAKWTYTGDTGADYWHKLFPGTCTGNHQSPIDIEPEETVYNPNLKDFAIWYDPPKPDSRMYIKNNGHTVEIRLEGDFYVSNGGLQHMYKAWQFHFHWGQEDNHGSEHLINGESSPIEMHLVTYNQELYTEISEAAVVPEGLAVLGTLYEISEEDNPTLATIVRALKHVRDPDVHEQVELPLISIRDLLPTDISRYYRYNGSLTTPGCFESVIWSVFDEKQTISIAQLREFKKLLYHKHRVSKNKNGDVAEDNRHRRSLNKADDKERLKRAVEGFLDELGIRGNKFQEAVLRSELLHSQMMGDMPQDDSAVVEKNEKDEDEKDTNKNNDENEHGIHGDEHQEEGEGKEHDHDTEHKDEHMEPDDEEGTYIQEVMVANFRPVQPLNNRVVYRSFKLRDSTYSETEVVNYRLGQSKDDNKGAASPNDDDDDGHDGATYSKLSLTAIVTVLILTVVFL